MNPPNQQPIFGPIELRLNGVLPPENLLVSARLLVREG
jgi:hypothetical protein